MSFKAPEEQPRPTVETGPGLTKQSMAKDTDINLIMAKYQRTGLVTFVNENQGEYMEAPEMDFHQAIDYIAKSKELFDEMPSSLRKRFNNDPGEFLDFVHDETNADEMVKLGLAKRTPEEPPTAPAEPAETTPEVENAP